MVPDLCTCFSFLELPSSNLYQYPLQERQVLGSEGPEHTTLGPTSRPCSRRVKTFRTVKTDYAMDPPRLLGYR